MAANTSQLSGVAGRYASALFDLANEGNALDAIEQDLDSLMSLLLESADLFELVYSPIYSREQQAAGMNAVLEQAGAEVLTRNFLGVVANNRRLFVIGDIVKSFHILLADHRGETTAEVTSARPLSVSQSQALNKALAAALRSDVKVESSVDESLLGGLIVRVGSRMIDSSLRTKLDNLQLAMKGVG